MTNRILLIGSGGHCHSIIDSLLSAGEYDQIGVVVRDGKELEIVRNDPVLCNYVTGTDDDLMRLKNEGWNDAFIAVGSIGNTGIRQRMLASLKEAGFHIPVIIDPSAIVAMNTEIGEGTLIAKRAVVNTGSCIGECAIINSGAVIEHDCRLGSFVHVSPGAIICGGVKIGDYTHVGAGAAVIQEIEIGRNTIIGAGSTVVNNIGDGSVAYGNPCRIARRRKGDGV